jgi:hypothetical protein
MSLSFGWSVSRRTGSIPVDICLLGERNLAIYFRRQAQWAHFSSLYTLKQNIHRQRQWPVNRDSETERQKRSAATSLILLFFMMSL